MKTFIVTDKLWARIHSYFPFYPSPTHGGRPRLSLRKVLEGIIYIKINKLPWKAAPKEYGSKTSLNDYYREWARKGVFHAINSEGLSLLDLDWENIDSLYTP